MRKIYILVLIIVVQSCWLGCMAQTRLQTGSLFENPTSVAQMNVIKSSDAKGWTLAPYKLNLFKSIEFSVSEQEASKIDFLIDRDAGNAHEKETEKVDGHYTYAVLCYSVTKGKKRLNSYLMVRSRGAGSGRIYKVVYMEGEATLDYLKSTLLNK